MDKRKLVSKSSLHRDVQPINQSLDKINSISDKQTNSHTNIVTQEKNELFHEGRLPDIRSSTLKPLNIHPKEKSSFIKSKKRNFCEIENNLSETDDFAVTSQVLKIPKQLNSQVSTNISFITNQQENIYLSKNSVSLRKSLDTNPIIEETIIPKNKITDHSLEDSDLDNDFDFSYDQYNIIKKKQNKITLDRNTKCTQDININQNSPRKICHESIETVTKSYISQRKQQDKSKEFQSFTKSKEYNVSDNKKSENINNRQYLSEKQNFHVPSVFSKFLQKCDIILSIDSIHILSKSSIFLKKRKIYKIIFFMLKFLCTDYPAIVKWKMKKILNLKQNQKKDIIDSIEEYIRNEENFVKMLNDMEISMDNDSFNVLSKISLARILLEVTEIQVDIYNIFISKLNESVLLA